MQDPDIAPDLNEESIDSDARNRELDHLLLKGGEEVAGIFLRPISAGDLAILMESGVGIVAGRTNSISFDTGAILWSQSTPREEVRKAFGAGQFRDRVLAFLDEYDPSLFEDAVPRVAQLVLQMNRAKTSIVADKGGTPSKSKKAGGRAG